MAFKLSVFYFFNFVGRWFTFISHCKNKRTMRDYFCFIFHQICTYISGTGHHSETELKLLVVIGEWLSSYGGAIHRVFSYFVYIFETDSPARMELGLWLQQPSVDVLQRGLWVLNATLLAVPKTTVLSQYDNTFLRYKVCDKKNQNTICSIRIVWKSFSYHSTKVSSVYHHPFPN